MQPLGCITAKLIHVKLATDGTNNDIENCVYIDSDQSPHWDQEIVS